MSINSDTDIRLALLQLGKDKNEYLLDQSCTPHKIIKWNASNKDSQPTDDELNSAYTAWKNANEYKENRVNTYPSWQEQMDMLYKDMLAGKLDTTGTWATHIKAVKDANPKPS